MVNNVFNLSIETSSESNNPTEDAFINDYFKFINDHFNQKERKIHDKYIEVQESFQDNWEDGEKKNDIVQKYEKLEISKTNEEDNNMEKNENPNSCEDDKKENIKKDIPKDIPKNKKGNIKKNKL